jgi:hypothetical protein
LSFYGRAVGWVGRIGPGQGLAQIYLDGALVQTIDLAASSTADRRIAFSRSWASLGNHTLRVRVLGTFTRPTVTVDAFVLLK